MQTTITAPAVEIVAVVAPVAKAAPKAKAVKRPAKADAPKAEKAPAKVKAEAKPAKAAATKGAPKKAAKVLNFTLMNRPGAGAPLFAYTDAVLTLTGMNKGKSVERRQLVKAIGETAVRYHANKGTMVIDDKGAVTLSAGGKLFFSDRVSKFDAVVRDAYMALIKDGKVDPLVCKNKEMLHAI